MVMLVVAFVSFSLFNFVGDPINNMVGEETSDEERAELISSALSSSDVSSPTILLIGSPTKLNSEKETKATTSITIADCIRRLKKYLINL